MKFQLVSLFSLLLSSATAAPSSPPEPKTFDIMALRSASPIHFSQVSAAKSGLFLDLPAQNATCKGDESKGSATFYVENEELVLYSSEGVKQKVFVDRSGMGQGIVGYITGDASLPRYGELKGWKVDADQNLWFKDTGLIACPNSIDGSWKIWLDLGLQQPGGNTGCLGFTARTLEIAKPVSCQYTQV
ncbi:Cell wall protein phiA [Trichoderma ghanense]|uniref:Cell wall protein phiA n=1 Tax=Trichoderma ghanense TaxID=65468 RepID=A0ABY2H3L6_9HYPO